MAGFRAITSVCEAVVQLLRASYRFEDFNNELELKVFTSRDFANPIGAGVSLFLYRIFANGVHRTPPGRPATDGRPTASQLPLDLHFLLTVWGKEASLQHTVAGWMMSTIEGMPILSAGELNAPAPGVFGPDETVELALTELTNEDLLRIWEVLGLGVYQLSVPYVARVIHVESRRTLFDLGPPVQERRQVAAVLEAPEEES